MNDQITILIADRNSHVRMFLMRELMAEGYRVVLAATAENVLKTVFTRDDIDLLILDPHLPGVDAPIILENLIDRIPVLPIVLHTHRRLEEENLPLDEKWYVIIEKAGNSVEHIKEAIQRLLSNIGKNRGSIHRCDKSESRNIKR